MTFNSAFLIVGGLSESYMYGLKMLPNIAAVMLGYVYSMLITFPFMYSLKLKSPYDYLMLRYRERRCVKMACLCLAMFYYFSFGSLFLWGCTAIVNIIMPQFISLGVANILLGLYSMSGSFLGGYVQSTRTNIAQFSAVLVGICLAMYFTIKIEVLIIFFISYSNRFLESFFFVFYHFLIDFNQINVNRKSTIWVQCGNRSRLSGS